MEENYIRNIIFSDEFEDYYSRMSDQIRKKYDYAYRLSNHNMLLVQKS